MSTPGMIVCRERTWRDDLAQNLPTSSCHLRHLMDGWMKESDVHYLDNKYLRPLLPGACPCPCLAISCLCKNVHCTLYNPSSPIQQENQAFIIISKKIKPRALSIFARICWLGIAFPLSYSVTTWKIMSDLTIRIIQRCSLNVVQVHF